MSGRHTAKPTKNRIAKLFLKNSKSSVQLIPNGVANMAQNLPVGQKDTITIEAVDAQGNVVAFTPDSSPTWQDGNPSILAESVAANGLSNVVIAAGAAGQSSFIGVSVSVGGVTYTAEDTITIVPGAIAGVRLVHTLSPIS